MSEVRALQELESMDDKEFNEFLEVVPPRVKLLVRGRMVDWRKVLPPYYKQHCESLF